MDSVADPNLQVVLATYTALQKKNSNLVIELLPTQIDHVHEWQHYPKNDVIDKRYHSQYYYHSHASNCPDRLPEHGHFHVFLRKPKIPDSMQPLYVSEKYKTEQKDALCHLFAIAMSHEGYPTAFFTTNHWVTRGLWYRAEEVAQFIDWFELSEEGEYALTNRWLNAMIRLFRNPLKELIFRRDEILCDWQKTFSGDQVFECRELEVLSLLPLK